MDYPDSWKEYIGISMTTLTDGEKREIQVVLPELTPALFGEPTTQGAAVKTEIQDILKDVKHTESIVIAQTVIATYMGRDNWTVPCIHKGELVRIFNYGGDWENLYWIPMGRQNDVRRFERMRWSIADEQKTLNDDGINVKKLNDSNTYFIEMDTRPGTKKILIRTNQSDGEAFMYQIVVDTINSCIIIEDNDDNWIRLDSPIQQIWMHNKAQSNVQMIGDIININSLNQINIKTKDLTVACETCVTNVEKSDIYVNKGTMSEQVTGAVTKVYDATCTFTCNADYTCTVKGTQKYLGGTFTVATEHGGIPNTVPLHPPVAW